MRKTNVLKTLFFLERKFGERFILALLSLAVFRLRNHISVFLLICFALEIKGFSDLLRKWCWFQGYNERFSEYLGWKLKFQKTETWFCRWNSNDNNNINIFLSLENSCTFVLVREKSWKPIFNTNSGLLQICIGKEIMLSKTTVNCLFSDICTSKLNEVQF